MWQGQDILTADDAAHVWVQEAYKGCRLKRRITVYDPPKPSKMTTIDSIVWKRFVTDISQPVTKLNAGQRTLWVSCFIVVILMLFVIFLLPYIGWIRKDVLPLLKWTRLVLVPLILCVMFMRFKITSSNKTLDEKIKSVCESYDTEFSRKGYSIQYRTKWTGFCKPKHAIPVRVVVFVAVPECVESQETQNTDPIDQGASGLE